MYLRHYDPQPVELVTRATLQMSPLSSDDDDDDTGVWINLASEVLESIDRAALALPTGEGKESFRPPDW